MSIAAWILAPLALGLGWMVLYVSALRSGPSRLSLGAMLAAAMPLAIAALVAAGAREWGPLAASLTGLLYLGLVVFGVPRANVVCRGSSLRSADSIGEETTLPALADTRPIEEVTG